MRFGPRFVRLSTLRGCLQPKRSIPSARFSTNSSQGPRVHRQPVLLSIATLTVGSVFVAFASFPGVDAFLLPWAISRSMTKPLSVRHSGRDNQDDADEATETDAAAIRAATSTPGVLILTGDHGTGKTRTAQQAAEGRQAIYINCRGFHSDATAVYSLLHQLVGEGALGIILTSYVKCVNLFLDMWSQNNAHDHTMFILFCQLLDNTRTAITRIGRKQQAQQPPPLIIFDDLEVMLRSKEHSPALKAFLEVFASMSLHLGYDTGLASVVFILEPTSLQPTGATSTYHPDRVATTPLSDTFPELCRRAVLAHFPPRERVPPANADLTHVASAPGVSPSRLWQLYRLAQRPEGVVLGQEQDANWERDARQLQVLEQSGHVVRCLGSDLTTLTSHDQPSRLAGQLIKYRSVQGAGEQPAQVDLRLIACDANNPHLLQPLQVAVPTEEARGTLKRLERELGRRMGGWWGSRVGLYTVCEAGFRPLVSDADVCSLRHGQVVMVGTPDHRARRALPSLLAAGQTQCRERSLR